MAITLNNHYSLNASRYNRILSATSLEQATYMGPFDRLFDSWFRNGTKRATIAKVYSELEAATPWSSTPLEQLARFDTLRKMVRDEHMDKFQVTAAKDSKFTWGYTLSIDGLASFSAKEIPFKTTFEASNPHHELIAFRDAQMLSGARKYLVETRQTARMSDIEQLSSQLTQLNNEHVNNDPQERGWTALARKFSIIAKALSGTGIPMHIHVQPSVTHGYDKCKRLNDGSHAVKITSVRHGYDTCEFLLGSTKCCSDLIKTDSSEHKNLMRIVNRIRKAPFQLGINLAPSQPIERSDRDLGNDKIFGDLETFILARFPMLSVITEGAETEDAGSRAETLIKSS